RLPCSHTPGPLPPFPTRRSSDLAARRYAQFAPSVPHALHMPSHIYVLLGMWPETVKGNIVAAAAEKSRGNPDDHMHALDYLVYGDRKSTRLNSSHLGISYAVFCL